MLFMLPNNQAIDAICAKNVQFALRPAGFRRLFS